MDVDETDLIPINRIRSFLRAELTKGLEGTDIKVSFVPFLTIILRQPGLSITEISRNAGMDKSSATRNIQQLVDLGYVEREGDPCKVNRVFLTERGMEVATRVDDLQRSAYSSLMSLIDGDDARTLERIMSSLRDELASRGH